MMEKEDGESMDETAIGTSTKLVNAQTELS